MAHCVGTFKECPQCYGCDQGLRSFCTTLTAELERLRQSQRMIEHSIAELREAGSLVAEQIERGGK